MAWFSVGDAAAFPLIILHGGPGGRTRPASLNWFEGLGLRCIAHDQRGCGHSTPLGRCEANTLADLVADIERLRQHLGLVRWAVAGGSWGALLAVAYAATHPDSVAGLFLRSSFLGSRAEVDAFFQPWARWLGETGAAWLGWSLATGPVPDPVRLFQALTEASRQRAGNGLDSERGQDGEPPWAARIALAWQAFENLQSAPGGLVLRPELRWSPPATDAPQPAGLMQVQQHYLQHDCFVDDARRAAWLSQLDTALADRPVALVHGLSDVVCSAGTSQMLAARWPQAHCHWVPDAGHDMDQPALRAALVSAAADWAGSVVALGAQPAPPLPWTFQRSLR